jgi:hypothetical protein
LHTLSSLANTCFLMSKFSNTGEMALAFCNADFNFQYFFGEQLHALYIIMR